MKRTIQIKRVVMVCSSCLKDQDKIVWFNSGQNHFYDQAFYCKPCWRKYFLMQPLEKRKEWKIISTIIGEKDEYLYNKNRSR